MAEIKIKIISFQLFQLILKNLFNALLIFGHPGRHFGGKAVAVSFILRKNIAGNIFGYTVMVHIGGIKIIDAVLYGIIEHFFRLGNVDFFRRFVDDR